MRCYVHFAKGAHNKVGMDEGEPPLHEEVALPRATTALPEAGVREAEADASVALSPVERKQRLLGQVALRVFDTVRLEADVAELVASTHEAGASWREIGEAAGISAQVARRKWNPVARRRWADYQRRYQHELRERGRNV
jgi:hypothetical protein